MEEGGKNLIPIKLIKRNPNTKIFTWKCRRKKTENER